ncbi:MAG: chorismate mutase [Actinomycetota bacterium]
MRLRAVRGATSVPRDRPDDIISATVMLLEEMMARNGVTKDQLVSILFTSTADLRSEFPAAAARRIGISDIPLLCAAEIDVPGAIGRCVRILMHLYTDLDYATLRHVYLGEARQLRTDLPE